MNTFFSACEEPAGLVSGSVLGLQISASSVYSTKYPPRDARLDTMGSKHIGWVASIGETNPWLQITLLRQFTLKSVLTQGCQNSDFWTEEYRIQYLENKIWTFYLGNDSALKVLV